MSLVSIGYEKCTLTLKMPFNAGCVSDIKEVIPGKMRRWNGELSIWYVSPVYLSKLVEVLQQYYKSEDILIDTPVFSRLKSSKLWRNRIRA